MSKFVFRVLGEAGRTPMLPWAEHDLTDENLAQINGLIKELLGREQPVTRRDVARLSDSSGTTYVVFASTVDELGRRKIVGMATLVVAEQLVGLKGHIEDVVVSSECRGLGLGKEIMLVLHKLAKRLEVESLELTSRPDREKANSLYRSLGYERRETNCYRLKL